MTDARWCVEQVVGVINDGGKSDYFAEDYHGTFHACLSTWHREATSRGYQASNFHIRRVDEPRSNTKRIPLYDD